MSRLDDEYCIFRGRDGERRWQAAIVLPMGRIWAMNTGIVCTDFIDRRCITSDFLLGVTIHDSTMYLRSSRLSEIIVPGLLRMLCCPLLANIGFATYVTLYAECGGVREVMLSLQDFT